MVPFFSSIDTVSLFNFIKNLFDFRFQSRANFFKKTMIRRITTVTIKGERVIVVTDLTSFILVSKTKARALKQKRREEDSLLLGSGNVVLHSVDLI